MLGHHRPYQYRPLRGYSDRFLGAGSRAGGPCTGSRPRDLNGYQSRSKGRGKARFLPNRNGDQPVRLPKKVQRLDRGWGPITTSRTTGNYAGQSNVSVPNTGFVGVAAAKVAALLE